MQAATRALGTPTSGLVERGCKLLLPSCPLRRHSLAHSPSFQWRSIFGGPNAPAKVTRKHVLAGVGISCVAVGVAAMGTTDTTQSVAVVTTVACPYCVRAKALLNDLNVPFREIDMTDNVEMLNSLKKETGQTTVPQVFIGGQLVGGASDLIQLSESQKLQQLLDGARGKPALPANLQYLLEASTAHKDEEPGPIPGASVADVLAKLANPTTGVQRKPTKDASGQTFDNSFTVRGALDWLEGNGYDEAAAQQALADLQQARLLIVLGAAASVDLSKDFDDQYVLRLVSDKPVPSRAEPLNTQYVWFGSARPAVEVSEGLRKAMLQLYGEYLSDDGRSVDYSGMASSALFGKYVDAAAELQKVDVGVLSREERLAFFINVYNALVVHALALFGPPQGTLDRLKFFENAKYNIGGIDYSTNDIEHGVLRGNAVSPANLFALIGLSIFGSKTFSSNDPRLKLIIQPEDPRIHFALNCGAKSCPPIRVFSADKLEAGLSTAATAFCNGEVEVDKASRTVTLSKIFQWYKSDFGTTEQMLRFIDSALPAGSDSDRRKADLAELLKDPSSIVVKHRPYDWGWNKK